MLRNPPDILITTPESLFLMLTSQARETLRSVETVIVDEVHAVAGTKRGAHLALLARAARPARRAAVCSASASRRRSARSRRSAASSRAAARSSSSTPARAKELDLEVVVPSTTCASSTTELPPSPRRGCRLERRRSIWPSIYPAILELVRAHRSTIVFVNNRRLAERLALRLNELAEEEIARAHHGSLAREQRVEIEELLKARADPVPRRDLVASSSASTWAPSTS